MNRRKIYFFSALILTLGSIALLVTGSSLLLLSLGGDTFIPLGTLTTWIGMIALPLTVYWGIKEMRSPSKKLNKVFSGLLKLIIVLGILWAPISYVFAGNFSFSFSVKETFQGGQEAMQWFWRLSYGIAIGAIVVVFMYWVSLLFQKREAKKEVSNK